VDPNADVLLLAADSNKGYVTGIGEGLDGGLNIEFVAFGICNQRLRDFPRHRDVHILLALLVNYVNDQLAVLLSDPNIVIRLLHCNELAFRRGLQGIENGAYIYTVGGEVPAMDLAIVQFTVVNSRNHFFGKSKRDVDANQFMGSWVTDTHVKVPIGRR